MRRRVREGLQVGIGFHQLIGALLHFELQFGVGTGQGCAGLAQRLLVPHTPRDVPQDHGEQSLALQVNLRDGRLNGELLAIGTQAIHRPQSTDRPGANPGQPKLRNLLAVLGPKSLREEPVQGLAQGLLACNAKHLLRRGVEQDNPLRGVGGNDGVHGRTDDAIQTGIAAPERLLRLLAEKLLFGFAQSPTHGRPEPCDPLLEHVIRCTHLQRLNGDIFPQRPRQEHKWHLRANPPRQAQRLKRIHPRHRIVGENQAMRSGVEKLLEPCDRVHPIALHLQSFGPQQVQHQFGIHGVVFQM